MKKKPTFKQLSYFLAVADRMHFGEAARYCHVTQSTLSAGIHELESTLGVILFERDNKRVFLTPVGKKLVQQARLILIAVDEMIESTLSARVPFSSSIRFGVIPTIAPYVLPGMLKSIANEYPKLQLIIREDLTANLLNQLHNTELDLLLLALPYPAKNIVSHHLFYDPFVLACPANHPLAKKSKLSVEDLKNEDLILLEDGHCLREHALQACRLQPTQIGIPYQATSLNTLLYMIANGMGITLLPQMAVSAKATVGLNIKTRKFIEKDVRRSIGLVWRKNDPRESEFQLLTEHLKAHIPFHHR